MDIGLTRCLVEHREGGWYALWRNPDGTYGMYCFACDVERTITQQDRPARGSP